MKQLFLGFLSFVLLGAIACTILVGWAVYAYKNKGPLAETKLVLIERGSGVNAIADKLKQENIISHDILFKIFGRLQFTTGETRQDKINQMQKAMTETIDALWEKRNPNLPFKTKDEALILASIIEKETSVADERKKVAGVFVNRLRKNMLLQTDPTVIYAITKGKIQEEGKGPLGRRLLRKDLKIDSPYNTYKYAGLPPGPIANPGRAAIEAALNPARHDYIFFVADGTGGHAFGKTLKEHNQNVQKWRAIRKNSN